MALWEYKVITSGKGGFANPQLLENFLNQLGKEEWEIVEFRSAPDNFLAFTGLARRATQRDWTLEAAAAAQAKAEEEQRKAEERAAAAAREREQERTMNSNPAAETVAGPADPVTEGVRDESFRRPRDTELDQDPEALADEAGAADIGDWDDLAEEDELPTLFEAVRPHLRRNQKGPGQSVAIDYLAKRWEQTPEDITGALIECGFTVPENEDSAPDYFEFEGDLYWLNKNNRGQLFLNVREKPRPAFRVTPVRKLDPNDPAAAELAAEHQAEVDRRAEQKRQQEAREAEKAAKAEAARAARAAAKAEREAAAAAKSSGGEPVATDGPLPEGEALLAALRPRMRENRRGGGFSGSTAYLAKALRHPETELVAALGALGLHVPEGNDKQAPVAIGGNLYWLNKDGRGGIWINGREKPEGEGAATADAATTESGESSGDAAAAVMESGRADDGASGSVADGETAGEGEASETDAGPLAPYRALLQPNKRGSGFSAPISDIADGLKRPLIDVVEALVALGLTVPDDPKDKAATVEAGQELFWINRNKDDSLWLNAKARTTRRARGGRGRKKADEAESAEAAEATEAPETTASSEVATPPADEAPTASTPELVEPTPAETPRENESSG